MDYIDRESLGGIVGPDRVDAVYRAIDLARDWQSNGVPPSSDIDRAVLKTIPIHHNWEFLIELDPEFEPAAATVLKTVSDITPYADIFDWDVMVESRNVGKGAYVSFLAAVCADPLMGEQLKRNIMTLVPQASMANDTRSVGAIVAALNRSFNPLVAKVLEHLVPRSSETQVIAYDPTTMQPMDDGSTGKVWDLVQMPEQIARNTRPWVTFMDGSGLLHPDFVRYVTRDSPESLTDDDRYSLLRDSPLDVVIITGSVSSASWESVFVAISPKPSVPEIALVHCGFVVKFNEPRLEEIAKNMPPTMEIRDGDKLMWADCGPKPESNTWSEIVLGGVSVEVYSDGHTWTNDECANLVATILDVDFDNRPEREGLMDFDEVNDVLFNTIYTDADDLVGARISEQVREILARGNPLELDALAKWYKLVTDASQGYDESTYDETRQFLIDQFPFKNDNDDGDNGNDDNNVKDAIVSTMFDFANDDEIADWIWRQVQYVWLKGSEEDRKILGDWLDQVLSAWTYQQRNSVDSGEWSVLRKFLINQFPFRPDPKFDEFEVRKVLYAMIFTDSEDDVAQSVLNQAIDVLRNGSKNEVDLFDRWYKMVTDAQSRQGDDSFDERAYYETRQFLIDQFPFDLPIQRFDMDEVSQVLFNTIYANADDPVGAKILKQFKEIDEYGNARDIASLTSWYNQVTKARSEQTELVDDDSYDQVRKSLIDAFPFKDDAKTQSKVYTMQGTIEELRGRFHNGLPFFRKFIDTRPGRLGETEFEIAQTLQRETPHKNVVQIYNVQPNYIDMELVEDSVACNQELVNTLRSAKDHLQSLGIAYIDWKPDNFGTDKDGNPKVYDFDASGMFLDDAWVREPSLQSIAYRRFMHLNDPIAIDNACFEEFLQNHPSCNVNV